MTTAAGYSTNCWLAGVPYTVHCVAALKDFCTHELASHYQATNQLAPAGVQPTLHVCSGSALTPASTERMLQHPQGQSWLTEEGHFILQTAQAHIEVQLQPTLAVTLTLHAPPNETTHIEFGYALQALMRYRGRYTAHAAAVVEPRTQTGIMLLGASGSGKTTTALQLVRQGWGYLSDDLLLLGQTAQGITAWGLRRAFAATEQTLAACAYTGAQRPTGSRMGAEIPKLAFDPQALFPAQYVKQCVPRHLIFVEIADRDKSELLPRAPRDSVQQLLPQSQWACFDPATINQHLKLLLTLSEQAQGWTLKAGRDWLLHPTEAAQRLIETIS